jgi:hypothetical protein
MLLVELNIPPIGINKICYFSESKLCRQKYDQLFAEIFNPKSQTPQMKPWQT